MINQHQVIVEEIKVGISEWKASTAPHRLITLGLGSCVGIVLFDSFNRVGGLSHIMLPNSKQFKNNGKKGKFPDTAIPLLVEDMVKLGARRSAIKAKIAGGAKMFSSVGTSFTNNIGERNVEQTCKVLSDMGIPLLAADVGGNKGRTIIFDTQEGIVWIRTLGNHTYEL
ncbi:MAG TPA: chemotaxis protein CheD [Clostridia bacterium]|jgi:chemotaxis protein CheD|nr:chemotaxis protein CheD [Clostridia bacterium]